MTPVALSESSERVLERERRFHDGWASRTAVADVRVRAGGQPPEHGEHDRRGELHRARSANAISDSGMTAVRIGIHSGWCSTPIAHSADTSKRPATRSWA